MVVIEHLMWHGPLNFIQRTNTFGIMSAHMNLNETCSTVWICLPMVNTLVAAASTSKWQRHYLLTCTMHCMPVLHIDPFLVTKV
jgi:hypothetical protein